MSTILHADGIKTVAHTSRYREHERAQRMAELSTK